MKFDPDHLYDPCEKCISQILCDDIECNEKTEYENYIRSPEYAFHLAIRKKHNEKAIKIIRDVKFMTPLSQLVRGMK